MRCCLINPLWGTRASVSCMPPLGLAYLASVLEKDGHAVRIIDRMAIFYKNWDMHFDDLDRITEKQLLEFEPQLIGIGSTTIQFHDTKHLARLIRNLPLTKDVPLVIGGYHPSAEPERTLEECPEADIVCRGEGEKTLLELASGKNQGDVMGITFRKNEELCSTPDRPLMQDIDSIPMPARHLLDMEFYNSVDKRAHTTLSGLPLRTATMLTSRGCPFHCAFCSIRSVHSGVRFHSRERVIEEIDFVVGNYEVDLLWIADDMFLAKRSRVEEVVCEALIDRKVKWACAVHVNCVDENIMRLMKKAGCIYVVYGLESGSQRMLDIMNKKTTVEKNSRAVEMANKVGILVNSAFIVNLPEETEEDFRMTIDFIKKHRIYAANLNNLMPLPGSPFYTRLIGEGILKYSPKLWKEIGYLHTSTKDVPLYTRISRQRFIELWNEANLIITPNNMSNYIRSNWHRDPLTCFEYLIILGGKWLERKENPLHFLYPYIYLPAKHVYLSAKKLLMSDGW